MILLVGGILLFNLLYVFEIESRLRRLETCQKLIASLEAVKYNRPQSPESKL